MSLVEFPGAHTAQPARPGPGDVLALVDDFWGLAQRIAATEFVPTALRRRPEAVLAALLSGAERGLGPMESLRSVHVIEGRPTLSAEAMRALVFAAGHEIEILETNAQRASVTGRRNGATSSSPPFTWTIDRARRARLVNKDNWQKYPESMLLARVTADLCRALFPDVIAGLAVTEEVADELEAPPATATIRPTRTRTKPAVETPAEPAELTAPAPEAPAARQQRSGWRSRSPELPPDDPIDVDADEQQSPVDVDEIPGSDRPSWAPAPDDTQPADPGLARRIHAEIRAVLPDTMAPADVDAIRHALVAVVTRKRPDGPVTSSNDLTHEEQLALSELLTRAKAGQASITKEPGNIWALRAHGWRYDIILEPGHVGVTTSRVEPVDDTLPLDEAGDD